MGISNLLNFLKPITLPSHIQQFKGKRVGVDAMCWLHRSAASCAYEIIVEEPTEKFLKFILLMIQLLQDHEVTPVLIFDGLQIPAKAEENFKRSERRIAAKQEALNLITTKPNPKQDKEVLTKCQQAISISQWMVDLVIAACIELQVAVVVAPYEADAQLAYLCRIGELDAAISEDSDLLAYGCPRVIYKLDKEGECQEINMAFVLDTKVIGTVNPQFPFATFAAVKDATLYGTIEHIVLYSIACLLVATPCIGGMYPQADCISQLQNFSEKMFVDMCILTGSDYGQDVHLKGMGIKTAFKLISKYKSLTSALYFILEDPKWSTRLPKGFTKEEIIEKYLCAQSVFLFHVVYDVHLRRLVSICHSHKNPPAVLMKRNLTDIVGHPPENYKEYANCRINPRNGCLRSTELDKTSKSLVSLFKTKWRFNSFQVKTHFLLRQPNCLHTAQVETAPAEPSSNSIDHTAPYFGTNSYDSISHKPISIATQEKVLKVSTTSSDNSKLNRHTASCSNILSEGVVPPLTIGKGNVIKLSLSGKMDGGQRTLLFTKNASNHSAKEKKIADAALDEKAITSNSKKDIDDIENADPRKTSNNPIPIVEKNLKETFLAPISFTEPTLNNEKLSSVIKPFRIMDTSLIVSSTPSITVSSVSSEPTAKSASSHSASFTDVANPFAKYALQSHKRPLYTSVLQHKKGQMQAKPIDNIAAQRESRPHNSHLYNKRRKRFSVTVPSIFTEQSENNSKFAFL